MLCGLTMQELEWVPLEETACEYIEEMPDDPVEGLKEPPPFDPNGDNAEERLIEGSISLCIEFLYFSSVSFLYILNTDDLFISILSISEQVKHNK